MKYAGMPFGMWTMFAGSFQKQLTVVFGYDVDTAKTITKKAKPKYREIISELPEFEKGDRFKMNRSPFSNSGKPAMISWYFVFACFVMAFAVFVP